MSTGTWHRLCLGPCAVNIPFETHVVTGINHVWLTGLMTRIHRHNMCTAQADKCNKD